MHGAYYNFQIPVLPNHLIDSVDQEQNRPRRAEEERYDGEEADLAVGRGEGQREDDEGEAAVLDRGLEGDGHDLRGVCVERENAFVQRRLLCNWVLIIFKFS